MLFSDSVYIGVDSTSGEKSFTCAALNKDLGLLSLIDGELEDVAGFVAGPNSAIVAVNSPMSVNRGLVRELLTREMQTPHQIRGAEMRKVEYELRERGIFVSGTPASTALCPAWMQMGFRLYGKLDVAGYKKYPERGSAHQYLETHPHACFCVLAGSPPLPKSSLEGRLQRQLILHEQGIGIRDPMDFFEEITRFKLAKGVFPMELLYLPGQLDALVAAFTAWCVANKPDRISSIGDKSEGMIYLPISKLKEKY